jgi:biotin synthase-like enzyme
VFVILVDCCCFVLFCQAQVHRYAHNFREVQQCTLLSIKTGGCSEDCSYCPQSSRYDTGVKAQRLVTKETVMEAAKRVCFFSFLFFSYLIPFFIFIFIFIFLIYGI